MVLMAEAGLHSFDYDAGRRLHSEMEVGELDDDAKRTVILKLHPNADVGRLLLQRCGIRPRWLTGNDARFLSRRLRDEEFSPAVTRNVLEHLGHDPKPTTSLEPITGYRNLPQRKNLLRPRIAGSRVQRRNHRKRLGDVGSTDRRTPSAQTK